MVPRSLIALNILFRAFFIEFLFFLRAHSVRFFGEFFQPHFLFSLRKGNGVETPKEKRAWGNLSNGFPEPHLAAASEEARPWNLRRMEVGKNTIEL